MAATLPDGASEEAARRRGILALPAVLVVSTLLLLPLLHMLWISLSRYDPADLVAQAFTFENYGRLIASPFYRRVLLTTFGVSCITTAACLVAGLPVAYFLARLQSAQMKSLMLILVVVPLMTGNAVRTAGWMVILDYGGLANALLLKLGIVAQPMHILYTPTAVLIGLISVLLPFMIVILHSVMEGIDRSLEEASLNLGASAPTTFLRVVLPLALPGIISGCVLCFILCMNAYATPVLLGGPSFSMMAPKIYEQISGTQNWPFGAALAFTLVAFTAMLLLISRFAFRRTAGAR